jgi:hypothetical protein
VQTLNAAIEADVDIPNHVKRRLTSQALAGWYRTSQDPSDVQAFERALNEAAASLNDRSEPLTVVTLWNLGLTREVAFEVDGLWTSIGASSTLTGLDLGQIWRRAIDFWYSGPPRWLFQDGDHWRPVGALVPAVTEVSAPDWMTGLEFVSRSHDLIRAALSKPTSIQLSLQWSRLPAPLGAVRASPVWAVFGGSRQLIDVAYGLGDYHDIPRIDLTEANVTMAQAVLKEVDIDASNQSVASFKSKLLRLYQAALDSADRQSQFLSFWQVVEAATVTEAGTRDQVESRLVTLLGIGPESIDFHLAKAMAALRHDLVHRGTYPADDLELPLVLRWLADRALARAWDLVETLAGVNEMRDFFQYATQKTTALERLAKVITHILGNRAR